MPTTATVRSTTDSLRQEIVIDDRHALYTDEPADLGGDDTAATPYQLLAGALAACVVTTIRMYARRKGWELDEIAVDATFNDDVRAPRCTFEVRLPEGLDEERRARLEHVAQSCAVHRTLERGVTFEHTVATAAAA